MTRAAHYRIRHATHYRYAADVAHSHHLLHLVPRPAPWQECLTHSVSIEPAATHRGAEVDAFGNPVLRVELGQPHRTLSVVSRMEVQVHPRRAVDPGASQPWECVAGDLAYSGGWPARSSLEACRFRQESPYVRVKQVFTDYAADCFTPGRPVLAAAGELMQKLHRDLRYQPGATTIATPLMEVLEQRRGVCQDFAHLMIACLRARGLAARYVSGYIRSQMVGGAASHAWVAVYSTPFGWIELDPTNDSWVGTGHVAVAWGRDFGDVSPLRGIILGGGSHQLSVDVAVEPMQAAATP